MKTLYESIFDTFDDEGNVTTDSSELVKPIIIEWILENYKSTEKDFNKRINIENNNSGEWEVSIDYKGVSHEWPTTAFINKKANRLTNGSFVWGKVDGSFICNECGIKSLEGAPKEVGSDFSCALCPNIKSLEGAPKKVGGNFYCFSCAKLFSAKDVRRISKIKGRVIP